jgi:hypothetical protein
MKQSHRTQQFKRLLVRNKVSIALRKIHDWLMRFDKLNILALAEGRPTVSTVELDLEPSLQVALQRCRAAGVTQLQLYDVRGTARVHNSRLIRSKRHLLEAEERRRAYAPSLPELLPHEAVSEHMTDLYARKAAAAQSKQFQAGEQPQNTSLTTLLSEGSEFNTATVAESAAEESTASDETFWSLVEGAAATLH